jgi:non-heme chloroperoxidase
MKTIAFLLLGIASFFSVSTSAQYYDRDVYPKWFVESIPGRPDALEALRADFAEPIPVKTVNLKTGVKLEYIEQGNKDGIPVILLHGFPDSWRSYEQVINYLPKTFHVFAISQRGFGNSDHPSKSYYPKDFAGDVAAFMKSLNLPPAIIVGHSMGGVITQQLVVSYPYLVRGFVLEGAFVSFADKKEMADFKYVVDQLQDPLDTALAREFQQSTLAKPISEEYFNILLNESMKAEANVWKGVWEGLMTANFRAALPQVKKPALIIWGEKDVMAPRADQEFFTSAIKGSKFIEYKATGHSVHWEEPKRFAEDVVKFIESIK